MSARTTLQRWAVRTTLAATAASVFVFLYQRTRAVDLGQHGATTESLRRLQHLTAVSKEEVLAARFNLRTHYDPLTASLRETRNVIEQLAGDVHAVLGADAELDVALSELRREHRSFTAQVEQFKSHNSVLKNSLYYLPTAADNVHAALGTQAPATIASVDRLVQSTLVYNLLRTDTNREAQRVALAGLERQRAELGGPEASVLSTLVAHADTVVREQESVDPLLTELLGQSLEARTDRVEELYGARFAKLSARADFYRQVLYGWSVVLLIGLLFVGFKLRRLYSSLEHMVRERTKQLDLAVKELWGEMQLAKKIQMALVPKQVELRGCDVAAVMQPADQVGGDYYDVLRLEDTDWILIGDASGHGVPAGLVMMMCQTAVHTALHDNPRIAPDRLLSLVNRTLTENIRRLGEDKYMTMHALCRTPDGKFRFSGMHQDIFIYRASSQSIETIEPSGCFLGIEDDIDSMLDVRSFELEPGDAMLLYTDGITEARRDGVLLDNQGLKAVFGDLAARPAQQILDGILAHLSHYQVTDDVAAIVVKQQ